MSQDKTGNEEQELSDHADEGDVEEDGECVVKDVDASVSTSPSNADVMNAIMGMEKRVTNKIDGVFQVIKEVTERMKVAEERISGAEDEMVQLRTLTKTLQIQVKALTERADDMENRSRRNNLRLVGLSENEEGRDACTFLEKWIPSVPGLKTSTTLALERAHRIGPQPRNVNNSTPPPRTLIMKFLNYKQKEEVLRAAKVKGTFKYKEYTIRLFPDVSAETHKKQRAYDGIRQKLREKGIDKHRIIFPSRLLLTHREQSILFNTPAEVEHFVEGLDNERRERR